MQPSELAEQTSFFDVYYRECGVGCEYILRKLFLLHVYPEIVRAVLLICAEDKPYSLFKRYSEITHTSHRKKCRCKRTFVINNSAPVKNSVLFRHSERIGEPALLPLRRNNVKVAEDTEGRHITRPSRQKIGGAGNIIFPVSIEALFPAYLDHLVQRLLRHCSERRTRFRLSSDTRYRYEPVKNRQHEILIRVYIILDLFVHY